MPFNNTTFCDSRAYHRLGRSELVSGNSSTDSSAGLASLGFRGYSDHKKLEPSRDGLKQGGESVSPMASKEGKHGDMRRCIPDYCFCPSHDRFEKQLRSMTNL